MANASASKSRQAWQSARWASRDGAGNGGRSSSSRAEIASRASSQLTVALFFGDDRASTWGLLGSR